MYEHGRSIPMRALGQLTYKGSNISQSNDDAKLMPDSIAKSCNGSGKSESVHNRIQLENPDDPYTSG